MEERREVVILGGGPGGSTLAASLARRGRTALVLERERFPRFHIGESLLPRSVEVFQKIGVMAELESRFLRKYGARFLCSRTRRVNEYRFAEAFEAPYEYAFEVPRAEFDEVLLRHAARLGAEVREAWEALEVLFDGSRAVGVRARPTGGGAEVRVLADVVVDATGRDTLLASRTRNKSRIAHLDQTALFTHCRGAFRQSGPTREGNIQIVIFDHGWFWFIPFVGAVSSVGAVVSRGWLRTRPADEPLEAFFERTVLESAWAREFLEGAERVRPVGALADFSYRIDQLAGDGWLFVGDAGGFLDPLFSTGAHLAIKGADLAAEAIDAALTRGDVSRAAFAGYERSVRAAVDLFLGVVQSFYRGEFRELLFEENQRPILRKFITSVLSGDVFHPVPPPSWAQFTRERFPAEAPT